MRYEAFDGDQPIGLQFNQQTGGYYKLLSSENHSDVIVALSIRGRTAILHSSINPSNGFDHGVQHWQTQIKKEIRVGRRFTLTVDQPALGTPRNITIVRTK